MTPNPKPLEKEPTPYSQMMKALSDELQGPIPDGGAQGQAVNWLLKNYTVGECVMVLKEMFKESKPNGGWRGRVSWLNVKSEIGTRLSKLRQRTEPVVEQSEDSLTPQEAKELLNMLREDAERYGYQIELLERVSR